MLDKKDIIVAVALFLNFIFLILKSHRFRLNMLFLVGYYYYASPIS